MKALSFIKKGSKPGETEQSAPSAAQEVQQVDEITPAATIAPSVYSEKQLAQSSQENPFATPNPSRSNLISANCSSVVLTAHFPVQEPYFHSRRVKRENIARPWLQSRKDPRQRLLTIIPMLGFVIGIALGGYMVYSGYSSVPVHQYCPVLDEDFSSGLNDETWVREIQVGGFGNGCFDETTDSPENLFVAEGMLHIKPTLQDADLITGNNVLNLTALGTCTGTSWTDCVAVTNTTNGTIINPVKSARISTINSASIKYGRVEVEARLPAGDWLWPAIWLLPVHNTYGNWPNSGEIDIMESRGNNWTYPLGGNNIISSTLHWGPDGANDAWWRTYGKKNALQSTFNAKFHTFGLEWSEKYIYTYLDTRLNQVMYNKFSIPLWQRGHFPLSDSNGTSFVDPWSQTGDSATPFDQDFYLILNVAVGGTNGWFMDGEAGKPWVDASPTAKHDFWNARDQWYPTWQVGNGNDMVVKSVKMWQQKGYNGC